MENESQKLYRIIISLYAEISRNSKRSLNGKRTVHRFHREKLAREIEKVYPVHINNPENLWSINAFAEHVKRFNRDRRIPEIEEEICDILKLFFRDKVWAKDEIIFENVPETFILNGKTGNLKKNCLNGLRIEISERFGISDYSSGAYKFFEKPFTFGELVEWVYSHEKQNLKGG